jgi:VanZ family protein
MSNSRGNVGRWIWTWWPVVFMIAVIFVESTESLGADHTSGPLRFVYQAIFGAVPDDRWEVIHHYLRKTGHFLGYGLVGLSWLRAWRMTRPDWLFRTRALLAIVATAVIASCDEFHQSFLPNRTSSPWDVLLDCTGALIFVLLAGGIAWARRAPRLAKAA